MKDQDIIKMYLYLKSTVHFHGLVLLCLFLFSILGGCYGVTHTHVHTHVHTYTHTHVHTHTHTHTHSTHTQYTHTHTHTVHTQYTHAHTQYTHTHTHTVHTQYTHAHTQYTHAHTHTHTLNVNILVFCAIFVCVFALGCACQLLRTSGIQSLA